MGAREPASFDPLAASGSADDLAGSIAPEPLRGGRQPIGWLIRVHAVGVMSPSGFDELFESEYPRLVALGVAMVGDREVARELAQETMVRASVRWGELCGYDSPQGWLRRVMGNLLIDHHRSVVSERSAVERLGAFPPAVHGGLPEVSRWTELVEPLTPTQRLVATMYFAEDLSVADVARVLGVSPGTVKSTLSKVRRRLRQDSEVGHDRR